MLITVGNFKRCYLYKRIIGGRNVMRVMKDGEQIWPGEHDRIRKLTFELPGTKEADYPYWQHVEAGLDVGIYVREERQIVGYEDKVVSRDSPGEGFVKIRDVSSWHRSYYEWGRPIYGDVYYLADGCRAAKVELDGRRWYVKKELVVNYEVKYAQATWDGKGTLDFGEDGPYRGAVQVGEKVGFDVEMAERRDVATTYVETTKEYGVPLIKGTKFQCDYWKGGKKEPGGMILTVKGLPSNQQFVKAEGNQAGHWRGTLRYITPPSGLGNHDGWNKCEYKDEWKPGDTGYTVKVERHMGGGQTATPIYPTFKRTIKLKVVDIVYND